MSFENKLKKYGEKKTYKLYKIPYKQYQNKLTKKIEKHYEYIFYIKKEIDIIIDFFLGKQCKRNFGRCRKRDLFIDGGDTDAGYYRMRFSREVM